MQKTSIIIIDDHQLIREMWKIMLRMNSHYEIIADCGTFEEALKVIKNIRANVILLDINLSNDSGFDLIPVIRKYSPGTKILGASMHTQISFVKKMLRLGAHGYITKNSTPGEVDEAIREITKGNNYICNEIQQIQLEQLADDHINTGMNSLTQRQIEIIQLIRQGLNSREIADKLCISVRTVEVHRSHILKKLRLKNTAALINYVINNNIG